MSSPVPVSVAEQQALIIDMVGDENDLLATRIAAIWAKWAGKANIHPDLVYLYVRRDCIRIMLAKNRKKADFSQASGVTMKTGSWFDHLVSMLTETTTEIVRIERRAAASRPGVVTQLATTTGSVPPDSPNAPQPSDLLDANNPGYAGSPYQDTAPQGGIPTDTELSGAVG